MFKDYEESVPSSDISLLVNAQNENKRQIHELRESVDTINSVLHMYSERLGCLQSQFATLQDGVVRRQQILETQFDRITGLLESLHGCFREWDEKRGQP